MVEANRDTKSAASQPKSPESAGKDVFMYAPSAGAAKVTRWMSFWADVFIFVIMHYNLWPLVAIIALVYLSTHGHALIAVALVAIYMPSFLSGVEKTANGRQWDGLRHSKVWLTFLYRWRLLIFREQELDSSKQYIFGYHPHGIVIMSRIVTYAKVFETLFPGISCRALGASTMFRVPLARDICLWLGVVDASRSTAMKVLESGKSITVYPGGVKEMFTVNPKSKDNVLVLKNRLGFIKLAIRHGAHLVPTFVFNEKFMYHVWTPSPRVNSILQKIMPFPTLFFWGRFIWVPLDLPEGKPFGVVYGKPIAVTKNENPSDAEVQELHAIYMAEVERLFREYKGKFGYDEDEQLVIR